MLVEYLQILKDIGYFYYTFVTGKASPWLKNVFGSTFKKIAH